MTISVENGEIASLLFGERLPAGVADDEARASFASSIVQGGGKRRGIIVADDRVTKPLKFRPPTRIPDPAWAGYFFRTRRATRRDALRRALRAFRNRGISVQESMTKSIMLPSGISARRHLPSVWLTTTAANCAPSIRRARARKGLPLGGSIVFQGAIVMISVRFPRGLWQSSHTVPNADSWED